MLFGKKSDLVGLDIGSCTIKVCEIIDSKKGRSLKNFSMLDIPPGVIEDGSIREPEIAAQKIRELFKASGIKDQNVAISIGGFSIIAKNITVQTMSEKELQDTIHFEAEQYIPFDISDVNLDFQIIGENESNPNQMNVLLVAAKKEMVEDYINVVQLAGLNPLVLDVDAFALQNIFELNYEGEGESVALIDIGASKTSLNIVKKYSSVFMRDVTLGCNQINKKIRSLLGCSAEEAEDLKFDENSTKLSKKDLAEIISNIVSDWCAEIRRALDFFYSTYPDEQIKRIILSGGGANIKEFQELLAVETSTEVETINPFKGITIENKKLNPSYLEQVAPQAAICMGLAIRRVDDK